MTKEELIELSDLNREDNIKYVSSEAQGIAITLDSDRYAPTLCKLERAYICGRRKSEEQIEELEKENAELKEFYENEYFQISDRTADEKIKELEKHQVEVTIDDYSPYDENTWGDMHEEWFVPKEEVRDLLKENYALITKAKDHIKKLLDCLKQDTNDPQTNYYVCQYMDKAEQFISKVENSSCQGNLDN